MKSRCLNMVVLAFLAAWLAGCATPYQKSGFNLAGGGYGEKKISDSAYWVYFSGNGFARLDRVFNFWIYRCAELTLEHGYRYMALRPGAADPVGARDKNPEMLPASAATNRYTVEKGHFMPAVYSPSDEPRMVPVHGGGAIFIGGGGGAVTAYTSRGTVLMYSAPLPDEVAWALDAQTVRDFLQAYAKSNGDAPDPDLGLMIKQALVAHEQIIVDASKLILAPSNEAVSAQAEAGGTAGSNQPAVARSPRSAKEIIDKIESYNGAMHSLVHEHKQTESKNVGGTVVLSFDVSANGIVTKCQVASTTFATDEFPKALAASICRITFRPEDVTTTTVQSLPITIIPNKI